MSRAVIRRFADRHVIITGGSSGIGLSLCLRCASLGAKVSVIALDDRSSAELRSNPPAGRHVVHVEAADVARRSEVEDAVAKCVAAHGPCDVLVTCAGIVRPGYFEQLDPAEFEREMAVNYFGTLWATRAVVPSMIGRGSGHIVAISSFAGLLGVFGYSAYAPTKYAVRGLCETLRTELRPKGIGVSFVCPPDVDTPMLAGEDPYKPPELRRMSGTMAPIQPEVVADAILRAVTRGRSRVYPGSSTGLLARIVGAFPGITAFWSDRAVAKAAREVSAADRPHQYIRPRRR